MTTLTAQPVGGSKPDPALVVGTPPEDGKHVCLLVDGKTEFHADAFIVGPDVDLDRLVDTVKAQREHPILGIHGGPAMGALPK